MDRAELLAYYDTQLRTAAEMQGALESERLGELWLARFVRGALITHAPLPALPAQEVRELVRQAHARALELVREGQRVEWKIRTHDETTPVLTAVLSELGYVPEPVESVMVGEIARMREQLAGAGAAAAGAREGFRVRLLSADSPTAEADVAGMLLALGAAFGEDFSWLQEMYMRRLSEGRIAYFLAESLAGEPIGAGRAEWHLPSRSVGLWGGGVIPAWRGRGVYLALLDARLRAAEDVGCVVAHSDSSDMSAPIHARLGMHRVTETVPWIYKMPTP